MISFCVVAPLAKGFGAEGSNLCRGSLAPARRANCSNRKNGKADPTRPSRLEEGPRRFAAVFTLPKYRCVSPMASTSRVCHTSASKSSRARFIRSRASRARRRSRSRNVSSTRTSIDITLIQAKKPGLACMCTTAGSRSESIEGGEDLCRAPHLVALYVE